MSEDFVILVASMRKAQKDYADKPSNMILHRCKRLEAQVDAWIKLHVEETEKLTRWNKPLKTDETSAPYNLFDDIKKTKDSAA